MYSFLSKLFCRKRLKKILNKYTNYNVCLPNRINQYKKLFSKDTLSWSNMTIGADWDRRPKFESRLMDLSWSRPLSLSHFWHVLSLLNCPIKSVKAKHLLLKTFTMLQNIFYSPKYVHKSINSSFHKKIAMINKSVYQYKY